jgi:hypothetical protein
VTRKRKGDHLCTRVVRDQCQRNSMTKTPTASVKGIKALFHSEFPYQQLYWKAATVPTPYQQFLADAPGRWGRVSAGGVGAVGN